MPGDFLMGTFFPMLEETSGFQLTLMKKMGYDVVNLGNHEFDYGPRALAKILGKSAESRCHSLFGCFQCFLFSKRYQLTMH